MTRDFKRIGRIADILLLAQALIAIHTTFPVPSK